MISGRNAYVIHGGDLRTASTYTISSESVGTYTYNVGYYDDTRVLSYIDTLNAEVGALQEECADIKYNFTSYVTKSALEGASYITMADVDAQGFLKSIPSYYITETELNDAGYLTAVPAEYVNEDTLNRRLSSYVSELELEGMCYVDIWSLDSMGYLTSHQDLSAYVTKQQLSDSSYVTQRQLDGASYISSIPNYYITESELSACGYTIPLSSAQMNTLFPLN